MTYQILMHTILLAPMLIIVKGSLDFNPIFPYVELISKHLAPKQEMQSSGGKSCFTCNKLHWSTTSGLMMVVGFCRAPILHFSQAKGS